MVGVPAEATARESMPPRATVPRLRLLRELRTLTSVYEELRDTTGPVTTVLLGPARLVPPLVVVTSPEGARQMLSGHAGLFDKQALVFDEVRGLFGPNLFSVTDTPWKPRRRTLQPLFTPAHVASFATHMAEAADLLADRWQDARGVVDLDRDLRRLTLRVLGRSLFGRPLDRDALTLGPHVERSLRYVLNRSVTPLRAPRWLPTPQRRRARASRDVLRTLIADAVADRAQGATGDGELIDLLLTATDPETGTGMTRETIVDELMVFLIAGHDTTATTLTAALWLLGRHPQVQHQVAAEARAVGSVATADLPKLALTGRVVQEAMRLYPPAAALPRRATQDTSIGGYRIPKGTDVFVSTWAIHRDPHLWPQPTRFDPDRFLPERVKDRHRWAYLPFGAGPRSCVGDHFAVAEATIALATLVRRIEIESVDDEFPLTVPFTLTAHGPIPARVRRRRGDTDPGPSPDLLDPPLPSRRGR